jgi:glycosyltransferase involved in cell wall biosynthesis
MKRLLFFLPDDRFFLSHFLARARAAKAAGFDVVVLGREGEQAQAIRAQGMRFIGLPLRRDRLNPVREFFRVFLRVLKVYRQERPDVLHHIAIRPILHGSLAARLLGLRGVINAPVGMGYVFSSNQLKARFLRPIVRGLLRLLLHPPGAMVVFENPDDLQANADLGAVRADECVLIRGAGVDVHAFRPQPPASSVPVVTLAARMLRDKGVEEFAQAARLLRERGVVARFRLAGGLDSSNPTSIPEARLRAWQDEGVLEWLGHCTDMAAVWNASHIACLPSYREGLPKALLEALACGLPVVATDVPGCRETVEPQGNGLLVPARDSLALADALERLIASPELRERFGRRSREKAVSEFSDELVVAATLDLYAQAARHGAPAAHPGIDPLDDDEGSMNLSDVYGRK